MAKSEDGDVRKHLVSIRIDEPTLAYFRGMAAETGLPYQTLVNLYLRDCAAKKRRLRWIGRRR
jgi:uncharacterized protein (DUF4415 family)